ncbi:alpha/beta fold hydrolase [Pontibacter flavimaris]|uniref:Alpha/beta hydrolase n=1 Tax=Pontibacter flavimaris TaxID=1797110 RepID=A0A1Q5PHP3_9BACT|nr:alpha/beta fold hydrolase [Pontibacter flavimaris]OKL41727.1 alpha/beta hydrolase [Pontibacter flavimaris]
MRTNAKLYVALLLGGLLSLNAQCQSPASRSGTAAAATTADPVFEGLKYKYPVRKVTLPDGQIIAYVDQGKGPQTIILIHGLGSYLPAWNKNIPELSQHYRIIALDLPGYGKSSKENAQVGMKAYADAVLALMDELKIEKAVLAGHSMGGQVAITAALQAPERVQQLILAAPAGLETFTEQQKQLFKATVTPESIAKTTPEQIAANIKVNFFQMPADAQFMVEERVEMLNSAQFPDYSQAVAQGVASMVDEPVHDKLPQLQVPTLILFGENDALIPNRYFNPTLTTKAVADIGKERIPNSQVVLLPQVGHMLQFEQPEAFNKAVRDFLD